MACDRIDPLVTPFIDGQLPGDDRRTVEEHLRHCPPCHSRVVAEQAVHDLIRTRRPALNAAAAPRPLRARCWAIARLRPGEAVTPPQTVAPDRRGAPVSWRARVAPYALAASLVLLVGGAFLYQATDRSARVLAAQLTADHVKCFAMNRALGMHQMPAVVESSMASGFDWPMHLPEDPSSAGLELIGARPCLYGDGKIAHIMYRHQGHPVSLFMLPKTARAQQLVEVLGHEAAIWCVGNRTFVLVAREPRREVERMASFVQASLR
jgi:anti-sigma factor RsiW